MEIHITGRHFEVTDAVRSMLEEKFGRLERFHPGLQKIEILIKDEDRKRHCEAIIHIRSHGPIIVDVARETVQEAADLALDKCEQQLRRLKEKQEDRHRRDSGRSKRGGNE